MQITIDTSLPLNDTERQMLSVLMGVEYVLGEVGETTPAPAAKKAEPAKKATPAKKAAAKKPEPEPEEEPEPMAEEPLEDEEEPEEEETEEDADDVSDEDLLAMAVKKATEMVAGGDAAKVREALDAAGASRVRELNKDNVRDFFKALP
jgi:outer membrane biosynthesis protein TonB